MLTAAASFTPPAMTVSRAALGAHSNEALTAVAGGPRVLRPWARREKSATSSSYLSLSFGEVLGKERLDFVEGNQVGAVVEVDVTSSGSYHQLTPLLRLFVDRV